MKTKNIPFIFYVKVMSPVVKFLTNKLSPLSETEKKVSSDMIKKLLKQKVTPSILSGWYYNNKIKYFPEKIDNIKSPHKFLADGGGDCDDFVEFSHYILTRKGYVCNRLYLKSEDNKNNHVVLVARKKGKISIMDNQACFGGIKSMDEACEYFASDGYTEHILV